MKKYSKQEYRRIGIYSFKEVEDLVLEKLYSKRKEYAIIKVDNMEVKIKLNSQRYQVFFEKGFVCADCGAAAEYFALEQDKKDVGNTYHFNLYGVVDGVEMLFTKDHIIPKSKGGENKVSNYQTMCYNCNQEKGDKENGI